MSVDPENLSTRPFRVNTDGDVEMAASRTFDANGSEVVNAAAPTAATSLARAQDCKSHLFVTSTGTVTVNAALFAANLLGPGSTHLFVRFTGSGVKTLQLADDFNSVGLLITVFKNDAASSIVVECIGSSPPTILGQAGPLELQPTISESRSFSLAASGNDFRFVGLPRIAEAVDTAFVADGAVTTDKLDDEAVTDEKIAADALDGWVFGESPEVPTPSADEHAVNRGYVPSGTTAAVTSSPSNVTSVTATWLWIRVGDFVTATLRATLTNSNVATPKSFEATMPFPPVGGTWGSALRVGGGVANNGSTVEVAGVSGQARVLVQTQEDTNGSATRTWAATFVYQAAPVSP